MRSGLSLESGRIALRDGERLFRLEVNGLDIRPGQVTALTGGSGSGKTLLLELLGLLRAPGEGTRYGWTGADGVRQDLCELWRRGSRGVGLARQRGRLFGFVPQTGGLVPFLDVAGNVVLPQKITGRIDRAWIDRLLARLSLEDVRSLYPAALSIGQRQRVAIARALSHRPPFVIADEPTSALDPENSERVLNLFLEVAVDEGSAVILSSHDMQRIAEMGLSRRHLVTDRPDTTTIRARLVEAA